ncbi:hypothetical protein QHH11_02690 [Aphanizomenon sp. PH219]|nr:hypothetical protein [Aphanizomenon sp. 202]MDK2458057.1 hypothetical protein [Aphanizomenon sp. PH219]
MAMKQNFEIIFRRENSFFPFLVNIHTLSFQSDPEYITNLIECYGEDIISFLKQFLSLFAESSNNDTLEEILKFDVRNRWSQLFPQFGSLEELANH